MYSIRFFLLLLVSGFLSCATVPAKATEDQSRYLQKILLVVDSPDAELRLRYENALKIQARLYTPRVDTLVSAPIMPNLKALSNEKELLALAVAQKADGVLVIKNPNTITNDVTVCPRSSGQDVVVQVVDLLTTKCSTVQLPQVTCDAHLYTASPYEEVWHRDLSMETTAKDRKSADKLFGEIAIEIFKNIQRSKFILPSRYQNM
jgi:hypothetical protein